MAVKTERDSDDAILSVVCCVGMRMPPPPPGMLPVRMPMMRPPMRPPPAGYIPPPPSGRPPAAASIHYPSQDPSRMGSIPKPDTEWWNLAMVTPAGSSMFLGVSLGRLVLRVKSQHPENFWSLHIQYERQEPSFAWRPKLDARKLLTDRTCWRASVCDSWPC